MPYLSVPIFTFVQVVFHAISSHVTNILKTVFYNPQMGVLTYAPLFAI